MISYGQRDFLGPTAVASKILQSKSVLCLCSLVWWLTHNVTIFRENKDSTPPSSKHENSPANFPQTCRRAPRQVRFISIIFWRFAKRILAKCLVRRALRGAPGQGMSRPAGECEVQPVNAQIAPHPPPPPPPGWRTREKEEERERTSIQQSIQPSMQTSIQTSSQQGPRSASLRSQARSSQQARSRKGR